MTMANRLFSASAASPAAAAARAIACSSASVRKLETNNAYRVHATISSLSSCCTARPQDRAGVVW